VKKTEAQLRRDARAIFQASLKAADPKQAILRHAPRLQPMLDASYEHIYVIGAGKASAVMAQAVEKLLGKRVTGGVINVKDGHTAPLKRIELVECGHPVPDERGVRGAERIAELARQATAKDLVICLISGGGSALLTMPAQGLTLADKQAVTRLLLECGANIHEINTVRKHLSVIKGGQLAKRVAPAKLLTLVLSDVIGDDLSVIGSGPTWPDASTFADALDVLRRYEIVDRTPVAVLKHLEESLDETPKPGDPAFANAVTVIAGSNRLAVEAAQAEAAKRGYHPLILGTRIEGETRDVARMHAAIALEVLESNRPAKKPACLISGGETTVTIKGSGLGGRNQEFALAAAIEIDDAANIVVLSGGTDGTDGPTDAAGAIATHTTVDRAEMMDLHARAMLAANDSYRFFEPLGDLIKTGPTGTNVMDVRLLLVADA
jgi:hydroxypyruvate reductase